MENCTLSDIYTELAKATTIFNFVTIPIYVIITCAFILKRNVFSSAFYQVAISLSISDNVALFIDGSEASVLFWEENKYARYVDWTCWGNCIFCIVLMAFIRFVSSIAPSRSKEMFGKRNMNILLVVLWMLSFVYATPILLPGFLVADECGRMDPNVVDQQAIDLYLASTLIDICVLVSVILLYLGLLVVIIRVRWRVGKEAVPKSERNLILQTFLVALIFLIAEIPALELIPGLEIDRYVNNLLICLFYGVNPYVYLLMNSTLRTVLWKTVMKMFGRHDQVSAVATVSGNRIAWATAANPVTEIRN